MKTTHLLVALLLLAPALLRAQAQPTRTLAERLGYSADTKLLIIHSDDLAVAHSEDKASFKAMEEGVVSSGSIMVPCPWLPEVAAYAKKHPECDFGLHLTLTSEWLPYKWGPVSNPKDVPTLVDSMGYFYSNCGDLGKVARPEEVERELRAQIIQAQKMGIKPTHLDSHMGCLIFARAGYFGAYLKVAREFGIPAMISREFLNLPDSFRTQITPRDIVADRILTAEAGDFKDGLKSYYVKTLTELQAGVNVLLIHTASDDSEMQGMTYNNPAYPAWCAAWRQSDLDYFTSKACRKLLKKQHIKVVTWREVGKLLAQP